LVAGTMQVLMNDGATALTTKRITAAAGMSQPSFYVHFSDMDDALCAVADELSGKLRDSMHAARLRIVATGTPETIREAYSTAVYGLIDNPLFAQLMIAYRHDATTPLGRRMRDLDREFREDLKADVRRMGITEKVVNDLDVYVELISGMTGAIVEGLLTKRLKDPERSISALSDAAIGVFQALARQS
jgi:AcrR family transcriptional regulator